MQTLLAAALLPVFLAASSYAADTGVSIRLAEVKGEVSTRASASAAWTPVKDGAMLAPGGEAKTGRGASVVLAFSDGNKVRLGPATTFGVEGASSVKTSLRLFVGRLDAWVKRSNRTNFTVRHRAGVAAVRGTVFTMEGADAETSIALFSGALDLVDLFGLPASLTPGQIARVSVDAGLQGIASLPPGTPTPAEPAVAPPPPPTDTQTTVVPPDDLPATEVQPTLQANPTQESGTTESTCVETVSPSAPCP